MMPQVFSAQQSTEQNCVNKPCYKTPACPQVETAAFFFSFTGTYIKAGAGQDLVD